MTSKLTCKTAYLSIVQSKFNKNINIKFLFKSETLTSRSLRKGSILIEFHFYRAKTVFFLSLFFFLQ